MEIENTEGLKREINVFGLASSVLNNVVGAGIFVLPALIAAILGSASVLAYLMCGILILSIMLCFAEIGSKVTVTGGPYAYIQAAFGPFVGFLSYSVFWFGFGVISDAAVANAMVDMLAIPIKELSIPLYRNLFICFVFLFFMFLNIRGVKQGIRFIEINTIVKLIPLLLIVVVGIWNINPQNLTIQEWPSIDKLGKASLLLFFAFAGAETSLTVSGEIKEPKRTVPYGILMGIGIVVLLYILLQIISQGIMGASLVQYKEAPLAKIAEILMGKMGWIMLIGGAAFSIFVSLSGSILLYPRLLFASAKNDLAPRFLGRVHPKYATPFLAIISYTIIDICFSVLGGFEKLATIASATLLTIYLGVVLASIKIRIKDGPLANKGIRLPGGLSIHIFALITISWFLFQLAWNEIFGIVIFLAILTLIYAFIPIFKKMKLSQLRDNGLD